jgi:hypothetical protein
MAVMSPDLLTRGVAISFEFPVQLQFGLFVVSSIVVIGAVCWRQYQRHRTAEFYRRDLRDPEPYYRKSAVLGWIAYGLHRSSPDLLRLSEVETDPEVQRTLADSVRARSWEPESRRDHPLR